MTSIKRTNSDSAIKDNIKDANYPKPLSEVL